LFLDDADTKVATSSESAGSVEEEVHSHNTPRKPATGLSSRILEIRQSVASECRALLDEVSSLAEPDQGEVTLRKSISQAIQEFDAPHVPHSNHLPYAVRQSGRRISYLVNSGIEEGVNRVAVPTGVFCEGQDAYPAMVKFHSAKKGSGTHVVAASTLADAFPGAQSVRIHFAFDDWPEPIYEQETRN